MDSETNFSLVLEAAKYIEENLAEPITVASVCSQFEMSPWQFQRIFRALTGDSIGHFLRGRRMTVAAEQISAQSSLGFLDIAVTMQFGSQEAFTRAFKSYYGVTPGELKRRPNASDARRKPRIDAKLLHHINAGIQRVPEIRSFGPATLLGISQTSVSHLSLDTDLESTAPELFRRFEPIRIKIGNQKADARFGVFLGGDIGDSSVPIEYFAGVEVADGEKSTAELKNVEMLERKYAVFRNIGLGKESRRTIDYVYGIWLPESDYVRSGGGRF